MNLLDIFPNVISLHILPINIFVIYKCLRMLNNNNRNKTKLALKTSHYIKIIFKRDSRNRHKIIHCIQVIIVIDFLHFLIPTSFCLTIHVNIILGG